MPPRLGLEPEVSGSQEWPLSAMVAWPTGRNWGSKIPHYPYRKVALDIWRFPSRCDGDALDRRRMREAAKGFRRLKAHKQLPVLRAALDSNQNKISHGVLARL